MDANPVLPDPHYRALVEQMPDAVVYADREGTILLWNRGAEAVFGFAAEEVLGRSLDELTADGVGLSLAEAKALLAELQQRIVQSQIDEYVTCARVCPDCLTLRRLRDQRSRTLQTLFGTPKMS